MAKEIAQTLKPAVMANTIPSLKYYSFSQKSAVDHHPCPYDRQALSLGDSSFY